MWASSVMGQTYHCILLPNFYAYLYSFVRSPKDTVKWSEDPWKITLLDFHDVLAMFICYGHIVLANAMIFIPCSTVVETLKSISSKTELKNKMFTDIVKIYRILQILMRDYVSDCFGMMTFNLILLRTLQMSLNMYGLIRLLEYLSFESLTLFWANVVFFGLSYFLGWTSMANVKEKSKDFQTFWKGHLRRSFTQLRVNKELRKNIRVLRSLNNISYLVGSNFFAMTNVTLLNAVLLSTTNIVFFLQM